MRERNETYANLAGNAANAFGSILDGYQIQERNTYPQQMADEAVERLNQKADKQVLKTAAAPSLESIREEGMKRLRTQF